MEDLRSVRPVRATANASHQGLCPEKGWYFETTHTRHAPSLDGLPAEPLHFPYWGHWANAARSRHPGGVNVCMADGSVHFVQETIHIGLWQDLISIDGGEVVSIK